MSESPPSLQCLNHPQREAAARCASCETFFCRECVTEHELQMLCVACFRKISEDLKPVKKSSPWLLPIAVSLQLLLGILLVWISFYVVGRLVVAVPSDFHEGTLWEQIELGGSE